MSVEISTRRAIFNKNGEKAMKIFNFTISVTGSAKGTVMANSEEEACKLIHGGQWEDIDIDVEDVTALQQLARWRQREEQ